MPCLSGFELCSRWVPLLYGNFKFWGHLTNFLELMGTTKRTFQTVKVTFITHETILKDDF